MNKGKLFFIANSLLLIYSLNAHFSLDTENLNYFECEDLLSNEDSIQNKLEKQNIHKIQNLITMNFKNESSEIPNNNYYYFILNNTKQEDNSSITRPSSAIKNQNFLKYKNFTLEKNFQILLKVKKNPEFINNESNEKLNLEKMQKKGLYVWLMRNNKFSFENIRKNIEFNGLAFKIGEADIKFITSNKEKNSVIKPFFDSSNDYKSSTNQKTVSSNLREESIKITAVKNLIFVERFNNAKSKWEIAFFEILNFYTVENFGINLEIISDISDSNEAYTIEYLKVCPIKSINYEVSAAASSANKHEIKKALTTTSDKIDRKEDNYFNIQPPKYDLNIFKKQIQSFVDLQQEENFIAAGKDKDQKEKFINDLFSLFEITDIFLSDLNLRYNSSSTINDSKSPLSEEYLKKHLLQVNQSLKAFGEMHDLIIKFLDKIKTSTTVSNSNINGNNENSDDRRLIDKVNNESRNPIIKRNETRISFESLIDSINQITKELEAQKQKNDFKLLENFNLMKTNFNRIDKNLKIIIADCDKEIKSILSDLVSNHQDDYYFNLVEFLFLIVLSSMIILLYLIYRYVNLLTDISKDYIKLSRDINSIEKNNIS